MKKLIRLAVAIDINGEWRAAGWSVPVPGGGSNAEDHYMAREASSSRKRDAYVEVQFVEVEIDVPQRASAIRGKVVK